MRITEQIIVSDFLRNISKQRSDINDFQLKLASNKKVTKPSDDPIGTEKILRYSSAVGKNDVYKKNVQDSISSLETTFDTVDGIGKALSDLKTVAVAAGSVADPTDLSTYGEQVDGILQRIMDQANYKFNGKFIFAGTNTLDQPYTVNGSTVTVTPKGVGGKILVDIGGPQKEAINVNGSDLFQGTNLFDMVISLRDNLKAQKPPTEEQISGIDTQIDKVNTQLGKVGAIAERFRAVQTQMDNEGVRLQNFLGQENDIDLGDTIVKLTQAQTNLQAAFQSWSGVLQKTLFNFLS